MLNLYLALIDTDDDKARFTVLYDKYRKLMFYVAMDILKDEHLSEDAVQEAFIRIAKNFHKIDDVTCPQTRSFTVIITRNTAIDMFNKKSRTICFDEYESLDAAEADGNLFNTVSYKILADCLLKLPERYRDVLYLHHIYGYSLMEISSLLSISVESAKKRVQRARTMLKDLLAKEGYRYE